MKLRVTVEVFGDESVVTANGGYAINQDKAIAQGIIVGDLDIARGSGMHSTDPILTVRMRNVLDSVRQTIFDDSNATA